jgi:hypothetical protein
MAVVGVFAGCKEEETSRQEVVAWYAKNWTMVRGGLGYQGSDAQYHHFVARVTDEWVFLRVKRADLQLADVRPLPTSASTQVAYYAVDPSRNFEKVDGKVVGEATPPQKP